MMEAQDVLTQYLGRVRGGRLLDADEEKDLSRRARGGDMRARQRLIECNLRLVISVADHARTVRLPAHVVDAVYRLRRAENALSSELGREATEEEVVERLGVKPEEARRLREVSQPVSSINARINSEEGSEVGELLPDERSGDDYDRVEAGQWELTLVEAVRSLPEREARIIEMRHGLDGGETRTLRE